MLLNIAHVLAASRANGPGLRSVIWVQGCTIQCLDCQNRSLWPHSARRVRAVEDVAAWALRQPTRGITLTGGEPFDQALALAELARAVRGTGRDVVAFSGFSLAQLEGDVRPFAREFLATVDLLVDGPYDANQRCDEPLRGSANQRLHFLSRRISPEEIANLPRVEVTMGEQVACVTGFEIDDVATMWRDADG